MFKADMRNLSDLSVLFADLKEIYALFFRKFLGAEFGLPVAPS
jgi:hypothetical protein